ncbi:hypothetical protein CerSpe_087440 [Prunus speciosa]
MGVIIQFLCSYVTLPLYALVTQMGSTMKRTVFNEEVAEALKSWHNEAKKNTKLNHHSHSNTPFLSTPGTPSHGMRMSPVCLLHKHNNRSDADGYYESPRASNLELDHWETEGSSSHSLNDNNAGPSDPEEIRELDQEPTSTTQLPPAPPGIRTQHEVNITMSEFSFGNGK